MNFYKRHIGDYLKDTAHLSLLEHGVYTRLLDVYYTRESGIPDAQAARLIGARGKEECAALKVVLDEFFELVDGAWIQDRCEREIHATGPKTEDGDKAPARSGKALRQQAYRERRAALFEALRERGVTMPFKATMDELQDALLKITKASHDVTPVTDRVTPLVTDDQHNVTATNSHKPDSISQTPDLGVVVASGPPTASESDDFTPRNEADWQRYFAEHHGVLLNERSVHDRKKAWPLFSAWAKAGVTARQMDAAIAKAHADTTEPIAFLPAYADRVLASMSAARATPQHRTYHDDRADVIATLTGRNRRPEIDDGVIDATATVKRIDVAR
jgi:uncharacterized protein YdaU (DUF1376 family)